MADLTMPILGADMDAGTLVTWLKQPGDRVARGDIVAEVETEKGLIEIETFTAGTIERLLVEPGRKVPVGTPLASIREDGAAQRPAGPPSPVAAPPPTVPPERVRASPAARSRAAALGVAPDTVVGTGPGGAVTLEDVEKAAVASSVKGAPPMRRAIAAAMSRSKREIPHFYLATTIPLGRALEWLGRENEARTVTERLLPGVLLLKAVAVALRECPELNAGPPGAINVGVAISLRTGGLVAPAIADTDHLDVGTLMQRLRDLVTRARGGRLRSSELADSTITVTSLGDQGVETVVGVIFPPQVAIVGFGRVVERPWLDGGQVVAMPVVHATLSADHRVTDGHQAARFLAAVDRLLQTPEAL